MILMQTKYKGGDFMFNVFVVEDQKTMANIEKDILTYYEVGHDSFDMNLTVVTQDFENFCHNYVTESSSKNIYILDIDLKASINGLTLAKAIRQIDYQGYIIFLTSHTELASKSFDYHLKAINFIDKKKQNFQSLLNSTLDQILLENKAHLDSSKSLTFKYKQKMMHLLCDDILYIETHHTKRTLIIHTLTEHYTYHGTLKEIILLLPEYFIRCHKSFIINPSYITELDISEQQYMVLFSNNKFCYLSKKYISNPLRLLQLKEHYCHE